MQGLEPHLPGPKPGALTLTLHPVKTGTRSHFFSEAGRVHGHNPVASGRFAAGVTRPSPKQGLRYPTRPSTHTVSVGLDGFEPPASRSRSVRAAKLRYNPM